MLGWFCPKVDLRCEKSGPVDTKVELDSPVVVACGLPNGTGSHPPIHNIIRKKET